MSPRVLVGTAVKVCTVFLVGLLYSPSFTPAWQQHDVQELCRVMFDALEKRFRKDGHEQPELINELYQGDMKDYVKCLEVCVFSFFLSCSINCLQCNNESAREDHFLDIPLVIKPFGASRAYTSVVSTLKYSSSPLLSSLVFRKRP